ncbi:MAG: Rad52/Rad22 family DNA repair protein [Pseudomonadota bacterium]
MNRELLEKPFAPEQIKQRDGNFGKTLDYVEGHAIIQRLNDAFDAKWSFEILECEVFNDLDEVIAQGKLTAENVINEIRGVAPTNSTCRSCFVDRGSCVAVAN